MILAGCGGRSQNTGMEAPPFTLKDLHGRSVSLADFKGHPILMDFWATWCGPCRMSIPMVQEFYKRHKKDGLVVLGLNIDDDPSSVYAFVQHFGMTYPVLFAGGSGVPADYEVEGIPSFFIIDAEGRVVRHYEGFSEEMVDAWETELDHLLNSPAHQA